ncbi:MAG: hypothetical protein VW378_06820 [bacterium]
MKIIFRYISFLHYFTFFLFFHLFFIRPYFAVPVYTLDTVINPKNKADLSLLTANNYRYIKAAYHPHFLIDTMQVTLDLNIYLPLHDQALSRFNLSYLNLRYLAYNDTGNYEFLAGQLTNVTFGQGLLMNHFNTGVTFNDYSITDMGLLGHVWFSKLRLDVLWTLHNIQGLRISHRKLGPLNVQLSGSFLTDNDGVDLQHSGLHVKRPAQSAYAADVQLDLHGKLVQGFMEYVHLTDRSDGLMLGLKGDYWSIIRYKIAMNHLKKGFIPSYFNRSYYTHSLSSSLDAPPTSDPASSLQETQNGLVLGLDMIIEKFITFGVEYEKYTHKDIVNIGLTWNNMLYTSAAINYFQPLRGRDYRTFYVTLKCDHFKKFNNCFLRFSQQYSVTDIIHNYEVGIEITHSQILAWIEKEKPKLSRKRSQQN